MRPPTIPFETTSLTLSDGYRAHVRFWRPRRAPARLAYLYLHGIQSHGGWFAWSAATLAKASGDLVFLPDRRGSGRNQAARGDVPSADRWLDDIDDYSAWVGREFGVGRFAVVGVSWGGKLAAAWALRRPEHVARLLLIAPGLFPAVDLPPAAKLRVGLALLFRPRAAFPIPLDDPALFTDNPAGRKFIHTDPRRLTQVTARFLWHSRRVDAVLRKAPAQSLLAPVALLLAGRDRIIRNEPTAAWIRRVAAQPPEIIEFPAAAHTLEFEPDEFGLAQFLRGWAEGAGRVWAP
jgi:alpha-beta hydrolase superfamily lysophospholipase